VTVDVDGHQLALGRLGVIHGRVHGLAPAKVDQAMVIASDLRRPRTVKVEPDGTYRIEDLQPGNYMVRACIGSLDTYFRSSMRRFRAAGGNPAQLHPDVTIKEGSVVELDVRIDQDPVVDLAGQILVNGFGSGAKGFRVHLQEVNPMGPDAPAGGPGGFRPNQVSTTADQKGHFRLKDVMAGQYTMSLRANGRGGAEVYRQLIHIHADQKNIQPAISLTLGPFTGTVAPEGAAAAVDNPKARQRLWGQVLLLPGISEMPRDWRQFRRDNLVHGRPVRQGKFRFENLPVGDYLMVLRVNGFAPRIQPVFVDGSPVAREYQTGKRHRPKPKGKTKKAAPGGSASPKPSPKGTNGKKVKPKGKPGR